MAKVGSTKMIILDLEWNRGYDNKPLEEILQIGAVRLDRLGDRITDTFNAYIKPRVHKKFDPPAKMLPDLQASLTSELDFPAAMSAFRQWCGAETVFATWGGGDIDVLNQNCEYWKLPVLPADKVYDIQTAFSLLLGTEQQIALARAVEYCRIPDAFVYHNALNDAFYTAAVGGWMGAESLTLQRLPRRIRHFATLSYPTQPRQKVGPFLTAEAALDNRASRRFACPVCGSQAYVQRWYSANSTQYYSDFKCPEHGRFPCRLTLTPTDDGRWRGRLAVPAITPNLLQEYEYALHGDLHTCKGSKRKKKKYYWRMQRRAATIL